MTRTVSAPTEYTSFPEKWRCLSGSALKLIAVATMLIDHAAACFLQYSAKVLFVVQHYAVTLYALLRWVGRISFPIFAFLIVEGFIHTHDKIKYGRHLFEFALLSEIPWNLEHCGKIFMPDSQNVFFTLFLGFCALYVIEKFRDNRRVLMLLLLGLLVLSVVLRSDYGCSGFGFIIMLYFLRDNRIAQAVIGACFLSARWIAGLAFIPISMYNGERGFIQGKVLKYAFYVIYPAHMLLFYYLQLKIGYL